MNQDNIPIDRAEKVHGTHPGLKGAGLVATAGILCYANSLFNGFVFDDPAYINHPAIRHFEVGEIFLQRWLHLDLYRPLTLLSLALDFNWWGDDPRGYHLTNLALHAVNGVLFYCFSTRLLRGRTAALLAALFYSAHPLQTDVVNWISARGDLLMGLFLLAGLLCHGRGRDGDWRWRLLAWTCCAGSLLAKENGFLMPGLVWWWDYCFQKERKIGLRRFTRTWIRTHYPYGLVVVIALFWRLLALQSGAGEDSPAAANFLVEVPPVQRAMSIVAIFLRYLWLMAFPVHLSADYSCFSIPAVATPFDAFFLAGLAAILVLAHLSWRARAAVVSCAAGFFWMSLLPISNIFFLPPSAMAERYLYLALIPLSLVFGHVVGSWTGGEQPLRARRIAIVLACLVPVLYALRTVQRNRDWHSDQTLFAAVLQRYPDNVRAHENLGGSFLHVGRLQEAQKHYERAVVLAPDNLRPYYNLGLLHNRLRHYEAAVRAYRGALSLHPHHVDSHFGLGIVYQKMGRPLEAVPHYQEVLRQVPHHAQAAYNLARAYQRLERREAAVRQYEEVVSLNPGSVKAYYHLGQLYYEMARYRKMKRAWQTLLRLAPDHREAEKIRALVARHAAHERE